MIDFDSLGADSHFDVKLPTLDELLKQFEHATPDEVKDRWEDEAAYANDFEVRAADSERAWAHLKGLQDHYRYKGTWSKFLMRVLGGMIVFQWILLWRVGAGAWDFTEYQWLLPFFLSKTSAKLLVWPSS
ncbi:hypothetical protein QWZ10_09050 [Paracoccus cavernae]|uniref:Uncharacterized protein n=1 Tax=Paracoccus cavernae TaxID=1571207 RepID=A0ABT8D5D1_9RHOB|nr:hypothetical protein [Paracoccus cavernae]